MQASLYDGSVTSHKELESLQAEHAALKERQGEFEDQAIELMETAEPVELELAASYGRGRGVELHRSTGWTRRSPSPSQRSTSS